MSSFLLKLIACITMFIDHTGLILFSNNTICRIIGRIAMPIFAFQVGLGFSKTSCKWKYILRMFICALISEIPFLLMLNAYNLPYIANGTINYLPSFSLNICFTFTIALLILYFIDKRQKSPVLLVTIPFLLIISIIIPMDYGIFAILLVIISYFLKNKKIIFSLCFLLIAILYYYFKNSWLQLFMLLALPFIWLYNGKKGRSFKYYFYAFYPLHMLLIIFIKFYFNV